MATAARANDRSPHIKTETVDEKSGGEGGNQMGIRKRFDKNAAPLVARLSTRRAGGKLTSPAVSARALSLRILTAALRLWSSSISIMRTAGVNMSATGGRSNFGAPLPRELLPTVSESRASD